MKELNKIRFDEVEKALYINDQKAPLMGLADWVLSTLARCYPEAEIIFTDQPITNGNWQEYHCISMYEVDPSFLGFILRETKYRGHVTSLKLAGELSSQFGTDVPYLTVPVADGDEDAIVLWIDAESNNIQIVTVDVKTKE